MKRSELNFSYPEELVALEPRRPSRILWVEKGLPLEISKSDFLKKIPAGDILVINNTKVLKRRVFAEAGEILFLQSPDQQEWEVLFPAKKMKVGEEVSLPLGQSFRLLSKGRPQKIRTREPLSESYFEQVAELPLPPYIQKLRPNRHSNSNDEKWYQTAFAKSPGSLAAPTASLHFSAEDLKELAERGVQIQELTLHVGLGTFLPVMTEDLDEHPMHSEFYSVPEQVWSKISSARRSGVRVWALGTTVARVLETLARAERPQLTGWTDILLQVGSDFKLVDRLLTNFHQPESTLLALVMGFAGPEVVRAAYAKAIESQFRLFSYGDLSVWVPDVT